MTGRRMRQHALAMKCCATTVYKGGRGRVRGEEDERRGRVRGEEGEGR